MNSSSFLFTRNRSISLCTLSISEYRSVCELRKVLLSYFILKPIKQTQNDSSMSVNSDEEETIEKELMEYWKPKRMSDKELMEYWKAVQAKTGKPIHLDAFSKEPLDPNRPPRLPAKLGSRLHDKVDHHPNTRVQLPVQWDWQHRTAQPNESTEPVKEPKLTAPVKGPESPVPMQKN